LAKDITAVVNKRLQTLQNTIDGIVTSHQNSKDELDKAEKVVEKIKGELLNIHDHYTEINGTLLNKARDGTKEARAVVQTYQEFLPDYHHNHVIKAENHAKELEHEARRLKNSFYETEALSKNALTASKAYTEIAEALRNASKATSKAKTDAEDAYGYADPNSDKSLVNKATSAIEKSRDLEEAAKTTNNKDNEESLNRIQTNLDNVKLVEADIEKNISWIKDVHLLLDDHHDRINTVHNTVVQAQTTLADVQKRAENFAKDVEDLQKRAEAVGNFNEQTIRDEIENVTKSAAQISDSLKQLDDVRNRAEKHDEDMTEIRKDLSVLKEKIKEAREMAAKVKIAVKSEAKDRCVREYISPAHPSPSNTISLKYQPALD
uniref:Laminin domain-containing protein n=1 Tax=Acrobeloides nanus TaxID=290746 RepID=A0A914D9X5_9BILA